MLHYIGGIAANIVQTKPVSPSSFLRPGSKFHGTQQSERQVYDVQVEIKNVDMRESFLCGYLRIQGSFWATATFRFDINVNRAPDFRCRAY